MESAVHIWFVIIMGLILPALALLSQRRLSGIPSPLRDVVVVVSAGAGTGAGGRSFLKLTVMEGLLTRDEFDQYNEKGYVLKHNVFRPEELVDVLSAVEKVSLADMLSLLLFPLLCFDPS
jgi:hypothetical protein